MAENEKAITARVLIIMVAIVVILTFLPLLITRRWSWWEAWALALVSIASFAISRLIVARNNPDLIRERARFLRHGDAAPWDKVLAPLLGVGGALISIVAGVDGLIPANPPFGMGIKLISLGIILAGFWLSSYALIENSYFSGMVRLQTERGQTVVSSGPYGWIRHPGYAGSVLSYLVIPLFLDSLWAYLPVFFTIAVLAYRTLLEDRFLQENLTGYREYAERIRYRWFPGVW
jgi:protein-S-isoprenylcysteine O-methyltransferase Ste14